MSEVQAATAAPFAAPVAQIKVHKIHPSRFNLAETKRNVWHITPPDGTPFDALLDPSYWTHVSRKLRPTDRVEVFAEDGSYFAEFYVISAGDQSAKVALMRKIDLGEVVEDIAGIPGFKAMWRGPHHKHAVIRTKDNAPVQTGFDTREEAIEWIALND